MERPFTRLAIVNRGEPAMRVLHAVRELNESRTERIRTIALYTDAERHAMFVRHADESYGLGSAAARGQGRPRIPYLDYELLEKALVATRADAVWVGWGFVAEHPAFVELCDRLGIVFVGPSAEVMRRLGDKIEAKRLAEAAGVPVAAWSGGPVDTVEHALNEADKIGYPLMIKAAAGGGGRGIRRVNAPEDLPAAFESARAEARDAFGDATVLIERVLSPARHVEVQLIADGQGTAWAVGVRDCSYQRRNQKVIEESSSPALSAEQERELGDAAVRLALEVGYRGAGTVEFLYQPDERRLSFMEVNARLQVEHPVTEAVTGLDLVKLQLHVAAGGRLEGTPPATLGHAIEARLNAEDPALGFVPAPGRIELLRLPQGPGLRIDAGVAEGDTIPPEFDSMIAKIIAWGRDRNEALARLSCALADTMVVVDGGTTNQGFLLELLHRPEVARGEVDTGWLDRLQLRGEIAPAHDGDVALVQAAIELFDAEAALERASFYALARRGRPHADAPLERLVEVRFRGQGYRLGVSQVGPARYRVTMENASVEAEVEHLSDHERRLAIAGVTHRTVVSHQGPDVLVEVEGVPHRISRDDGGLVRALGPAVVVSIPVRAGDQVSAGEVVAIVESMKMENSLTAPFAGRVREVLVGPNVHVAAHTPLVRIEPAERGDTASADSGTRVCLPQTPAAPDLSTLERCRTGLERMEWLVLGYDVPPAEAHAIVDDLYEHCAEADGCRAQLLAGEHRLIELFADLHALTRPRHDEGEPDGVSVRSPEEYLHAYLRSLDAKAEGLSDQFVALLERALRHYGVGELDRTRALEEACHRLFVSQKRAEWAREIVVAILDRRLELARQLAARVGDDFREALDLLAAATEGRDPVLADLARELRFLYFDEPLIGAAREAAYADAEDNLKALAAEPEGEERDRIVGELVECPWPLAPLLSRRMHEADPALRHWLLEVITRRYYRRRTLGPFEEIESDGLLMLRSSFEHGGRPWQTLTVFVEPGGLRDALQSLAARAAALSDGSLCVADVHALHDHTAGPEEVRAALASVELPPSLRQLVFVLTEPGGRRGMSAVDILTFSMGPSGAEEDVALRGLHPMMAERLDLWRLSRFALERMSSAEDVYVFHATAHDNPKDERLFAVAEVRDLTAVRDDSGRTVALPELERMLIEALEPVRRFQAHRKRSRRLHWNRVMLQVWPTIELARDEIAALMERLAPATGGLGLEMLIVRGRMREADGEERERVLRFFTPAGKGVVMEVDDPPANPLEPLDEGGQRIISARRRGTLHPAEIVKLLAPAHDGHRWGHGQPHGDFVEYDLHADGTLEPVDRPPATNSSGVVVGLIRNYTERYPEGMLRVALLGDPTKALGSLSEGECRRIMAALDLAEELDVPLEWFALSAGARIAMDSGTENMDWIAAVLRRIIEFTQAGGELNVVVTGINVGAQPYWNAEATMLMHTRGILVMTPDSAMVLTGKDALDYSGGVSAEDNFGIGGYERVMGPNGQAQYWAPDLAGACRILLRYYDHAYVAPGERFPRRARTRDPYDRDVAGSPHSGAGSPLATVGDVFSDRTNPDRKQPFDIRSVMRAAVDADLQPLERWAGMRDAEAAVVWDAHLGGWPVTVLGIESRPLQRYGAVPADGPEQWTSGTLFPRSSKKIARAINAASGRRALVVLANLAGFDGSPESMRNWQLEFGAEIGRAVVNFEGPIIFCVVSRYHGGAFVVFSQKLNEDLYAVALEGAKASVIGGAPAAAVVFARDVDRATQADARIAAIDERIDAADPRSRPRLRAERAELWDAVRAEKMGELAARFDSIHSVERAREMGSVSEIIPPAEMRPFLIDAVERGMRRTLDRLGLDHATVGMAEPLHH